MKKILITGAGGFIGSHLTERLVRLGYKVKAFFEYNSFNSKGWLDHEGKNISGHYESVFGDVRDYETVYKALNNCSHIIHLAALIGIPYSYKSPRSYLETNVNGSLNVFLAAKQKKIEKIIHTSTSEVYGSAKYLPIDESHPNIGQSPYSASKIAADRFAESFFYSFNTPITIIRPFNTYGPRQSLRAIIPTIILQVINSKKNIEIGSVYPKRDFLYVDDTVDAFIKLIKSNVNTNGEIINIGTNYNISIKGLIKIILEIANKEEMKTFSLKDRTRPAISEVNNLLCNNNKAKKILKWSPKFSGIKGLKSGLSKTYDWYIKNQEINFFDINKYNI
jgi:NAD dependent epimerase/dehydratase